MSSLSATLVVVGLHIDIDCKILVQQRPFQTKWGGLWEFPGGKRDKMETMRAALIREWDEELGLKIEVGELITEAVIEFPDTVALLPLFRVYYDPVIEPVAKEGQTLARVTFEEAMELPGVPSMAAYKADVDAYLGKHRGRRATLEHFLGTPVGIGLMPRGFRLVAGEQGVCVRCNSTKNPTNTKNAKDEWEHHQIRCP
jgi:8-oxo-dGTP diphosphatase